jgi:DNA-entry nuclease
MRFLRKMFSGKLGRALMPIVSIILFLWLIQSSMGPGTDISDVVQEIFNTVSSSAGRTEAEPDRNNFETSNTGTSQTNNSESVGDSLHAIKTNPSDFISVSDIPAYSGDAYIAVNDNVPYFTDEDYSTEPFEYYSDLDSLGRCGLTYAVVCQETMPTEKRESISEVKPSGWKNQKYDFVDGGWVYNRCHLIGFQLSAENANKCNLITGTRYLNIEGSGPSGENNDSEGQRGEGSGSGSDGSDESDESGSSDSQSKSGKGKQGNGAGGSMSGSDTILIRSDKKTDENNESGSDEDSGKKGETSSEKNDSASQDASDSSTGKSGSDKKDTSDGSNSSSKGNRTDSSDKGSGSDSKNADGTSETDAKPNGSKSDEGKSDKDTKAEGGKDGKNTSAEPKKMTAKEAEKIKKEIDDISQKVPSSDNNDCTDSSCKTSSIFNSNNVGADAKNNAGENVRQQSKQEVGKNPQDKEIRNIPGGSGLPEKSAYDDVTSIVSDMQRTAAEAKTEKQREKDLREEAAELTDKYKNMLAQRECPNISYFNQKARFLNGIGSISITRVVTPPVGAESVYQAVAGVVKSVSRPTQREIIKAIKDKRNGYKLTGLTMGRRVEASLIHHNDGKCFSKSKSPEDVPELCVGVLLDQSESTMGEIINYERLLALTIEDMCRSIEIPAIINGYSGGGGTVRIISYVEPNSVDRKNALRLTSMRADGGTPTAEALAYMLNRLEKRPEPSKILFVVTDGNSNNKAYLPMLLTEAKRNHIMVIAAGIGACRQSIHSEFPENFLDISDMNSMPRNICNIIKRKLVK